MKEHPKLSKIAKFACEMFLNTENIAWRIWQILYTFVLRMENNTQLIPLGIHFLRINTKLQKISQPREAIFSIVYNILQRNFAIYYKV